MVPPAVSPDLTRASAYDYELPGSRIAQEPVEPRDASKLLVVRREGAAGSAADAAGGGPFQHRTFREIVELIPAGDVVVLNETRVFPARLRGAKPTGAPAEILLLRPVSEDEREWDALVRPGGKLKPGRVVDIGDGLRVHMVDSIPGGGRRVRLESELSPRDAIDRWGEMPLPPYIERSADARDRERYQTVYARATGSVAAPTAGLHFTPAVLEGLRERDVGIERITLHVGVGTFRPVDAEALAEHEMHAEWYDVPSDVAERLNRIRAGGGALWSVGTTVARTLESAVDEGGRIRPGSGWTELFIRPPYRFRAVDRLITNFHLPRSTLLMLVSAFAGYERTMAAYREAVAEGYRFYSYGDAMAIV
ncbi:MAG: tRNA preQ1(34) S-adenosylmethionine ribosyltransferase-isomerase QueA [Longimicrobiales bacterium]|nr:tRNA preQ1(34) S-adenosylmethionine ribosyltransferase-isomerase QueA [Longimicrobiales bacterium]